MSETPTPGTLSPADLFANLAERARAGEFASVAVAMVKQDGCSAQNWSACPAPLGMMGSLFLLHERFGEWMME